MKKKFANNIDSDLLWYIYESMEEGDCDFESAIRAYIRGYRDKGISDLLICCFCQSSIIKSKVWSWLYDKYELKSENGCPVDYTELHRVKHIYDMYNSLEKDPFDILLEETRACGMTPWLSVRMNDSHNASGNTFFLHGDIYYHAKEKGYFVGKDAVDNPWFSECYDYSHPFVRDKMLAYIEELLENHDSDGLELDFMRDIFCFDYSKNPDCKEIMTEFLATVRKKVNAIAKKRGHRIKLAIRLCSSIEYNKIFGFDALELMKRGLVDVIIPTSRWYCTESNMPIAEWKSLARPYGVEIYAGLEIMITLPWKQTEETMRAFSRVYTEEGADKIYLYNYFRTRGYEKEPPLEKRRVCDKAYADKFILDEYDEWLDSCFAAVYDPHEEGKCSRFVLTRFDRDVCPRGEEPFVPFPKDLTGGASFTIKTGDISKMRANLILGVSEGDAPTVEFDGARAEYLGKTQDIALTLDNVHNKVYGSDPYMSYTYHLYKIEPDSRHSHEAKVSGSAVLEYLEIKAQ